jgi:hypothetical protein
MPPGGSNRKMDITGNQPFDIEDSQVATVKQVTASGYEITISGLELELMRNALDEAERVSRFGIQVLDDVDTSPGAPSENSRLRREIDALAMREASLRSLQKTMAEVDRGGKATLMQHPRSGPAEVPGRAASTVASRIAGRMTDVTCRSVESSPRRASAL